MKHPYLSISGSLSLSLCVEASRVSQMAREEVLMEVEAMESVYGADCLVINRFPPHLHLHIKPRTADVSSQQFVEAVIRIRADLEYPDEPPVLDLMDSKGLDGQRQKDLMATLQDKSSQLSSCLMLVALCEEAVDQLSMINHPDGDCPMCLYPLVSEDKGGDVLPFMKLMSCFHCFHSECIIRWWNWLQTEQQIKSSGLDAQEGSGSWGNCPVCRKAFQTKDFEHVLNLVGFPQKDIKDNEDDVDDNLIRLESENKRRQKFEAVMKLQEGNNGLIEIRKDKVVMPGMFLPRTITSSVVETTEPQNLRNTEMSTETSSSGSTNSQTSRTISARVNLSGLSDMHNGMEKRNSSSRGNRGRSRRKGAAVWIKRTTTMS